MVPKVVFRPMTLEENIKVIEWAYFENNGSLDVHQYLLEYYPELSEVEVYDRGVILEKIHEVVSRDYFQYEKKIYDEVRRYQSSWDKYNDKYMMEISKYLNCSWGDIREISASVGLIPVFPRYLDTYSFSISTNVKEDMLNEPPRAAFVRSRRRGGCPNRKAGAGLLRTAAASNGGISATVW